MNRLVLFILSGLPGAGKTTLARELLASGWVDAIVAADDYFQRDGAYEYRAAEIKQAHAYCQNRVKDLLAEGFNVCVHNTNIDVRARDVYRRIGERAGAEVMYCDLFDYDMTDDQLHERNVHGVPRGAIRRMRSAYQRVQ